MNADRFFRLLPIAGLSWLWGVFFIRVHLWWNEASYYTYGWVVPLFAGLLFLRYYRGGSMQLVQKTDGRLLPIFGLLLIYVPLRLISEPDPFWRFPLWPEASILVSLTLTMVYCFYGASTTRAALIPCAFLFTALPWPAGAETVLVQGLTGFVVSATTEGLLWFGHPAEISGHAIRVGEDTILINNACSGIRSFQSLLVVGLFLAAYFRLKLSVAFATIVFAVFAAFFFNLCRALILALISLDGGDKAYAIWHDPVGYGSVTAAFLTLVIFARLFQNTEKPKTTTPSETDTCQPAFAPGVSVLLFATCMLPEGVNQLWFHVLAPSQEVPEWHVDWPVETRPIGKAVEDVLLFDYGELATIRLDGDRSAEVIHFGYDGSSPAASICSRNHDPATCMGHYGTRLYQGAKDVVCEVGGAKLAFRHYIAGDQERAGETMHVWWCPWVSDPRSGAFKDPGSSLMSKGRRFLSGKVSFKRKVLLVILPHSSKGKAETDLKAVVASLVRCDSK